MSEQWEALADLKDIELFPPFCSSEQLMDLNVPLDGITATTEEIFDFFPPTPPHSPYKIKAEVIDDIELKEELPEYADAGSWPDSVYWGMEACVNTNAYTVPVARRDYSVQTDVRHDCMWTGRCKSEQHVRASDVSGFSCDNYIRTESSTPEQTWTPLSPVSEEDGEVGLFAHQVHNPNKVRSRADHSYFSQPAISTVHHRTTLQRPPTATVVQFPSPPHTEEAEVPLPSSPTSSSTHVKRRLHQQLSAAIPKKCDNKALPITLTIKTDPGSKSVRVVAKSKGKDAPSSPEHTTTPPPAGTGKRRKSSGDSTPSPAKRTGRWSSRSNSDSSSDDSNTDKRHVHNNLERLRRVDMKNAFDRLRLLVPDLESNDRAAKVKILKLASVHCQRLTDEELGLEAKRDQLTRYHQMLQERLVALQS